MQGSKRTVLPSFDTSTTTDKSALMRSSSIHQELKGDRLPVRVNNQSTTRNLPTYPTRTKCVGNHFITFQQQLPVTVICPTKPATSIHISPPIHVLKLEPACSVTSQHFHLPPKYEDTHVTMNFSIYNANLDIMDISSALFRITQHIPSVQQHEMLEKLAALPPVPIKRITMELMGEVLQETLSSDKPFWLHPSFLMGCIRFVTSIMSTVACITKKKVAAWKPPALTGFLSLCRKDKNNTRMDDEDMDRPVYHPSGIIPTVIRPQESHGLCVIPQPARKKDHCK